jgi:tetratricopeptide (TPR) repeat protein
MKAEHVKAQADEAFRSGNFGAAVAKCEACCAPGVDGFSLRARRYSECIDLQPGGDADARLLCNRSLANHRAGRHKAAISDAARACELAPQSSKAWYRLGAARQGGGDPSGAADAFVLALRAQPGDAELRASMRRAMLRLTREGLAARLVRALDEAQGAGLLDVPSHQDVSSAEKEEALFRHIQLWHRDKPGPGDYYDYVALWSEAEWSVGGCTRLQHRCQSPS